MCFYSPNMLFCELSMSRKGDFTYFSHKKSITNGPLTPLNQHKSCLGIPRCESYNF